MKMENLVLERTMLDAEAWRQAVREGYVRVAEDGVHLRWMLGSLTLLAYLCGRLWCGDVGFLSRRTGYVVWRMGDRGVFPGAELNRLFGCSGLKQTRARRQGRKVPVHYELVDQLFEHGSTSGKLD